MGDVSQTELRAMPEEQSCSKQVVRVGEFLVQLGGKRNKHNGEVLHLLKLPTPLSWNKERLLWIAHLKEQESASMLSECGRDVIAHIISFLNPHVLIKTSDSDDSLLSPVYRRPK